MTAPARLALAVLGLLIRRASTRAAGCMQP
jgi:hypothetical protein